MSVTSKRPEPSRHFSMIRGLHLADLFTLGNAGCGMASIFLAMVFVGSGVTRDFLVATAMAPLALVFDIFDGKVARWRRRHSAMGRELDSLADIVSFGAGPAAMAFAAGMRGGWDAVILIYFVCCGVSRLARFNITAETLSSGSDKVKYFEGTPIPTSVVLCLVLAACAWGERLGAALPGGALQVGPWILHPLVLLFAVSGSLMISKTLRIPKV
ncbi:CDP-alcohol phosphatidyltransferase family protein [Chitinasiproducens palmae]|uniref:CDP-diacylglycerol--serine O-phosphatidyltransferase n=1 Tax=Chitinasiproducens palmae TaxID=1770053 RepID=A0A1H2PRG7_9BURK|nr:CDP-alcohol phosphatidyltransferase family protein [Chitinasiproducens palmae]SDV49047.1 CDP-diacylglycerol--serine O-phosphatidyltransferase [Chitinasiproducens palmae]